MDRQRTACAYLVIRNVARVEMRVNPAVLAVSLAFILYPMRPHVVKSVPKNILQVIECNKLKDEYITIFYFHR